MFNSFSKVEVFKWLTPIRANLLWRSFKNLRFLDRLLLHLHVSRPYAKEGDDYINAARGSRSPAPKQVCFLPIFWVGLKPCRDAQSHEPPHRDPSFPDKSMIVGENTVLECLRKRVKGYSRCGGRGSLAVCHMSINSASTECKTLHFLI